MVRFHLFTGLVVPGLHVWRASGANTNLKLYLHPTGPSVNGWATFQAELDPSNTSSIYFTLFEWVNGGGTQANWENSAFVRKLDRVGNAFPSDVWLFQDSKQTCLTDPGALASANVRIHLVTAQRYRNGLLYLWQKRDAGETLPPAGLDATGPFWDLPLTGERQHYFNFKFRNQAGDQWESDAANRTWTAAMGAEVWVKSEAPEIVDTEPQKKTLRVHFLQGAGLRTPTMQLWQDTSDYAESLQGVADGATGRFVFEKAIYTRMKYGARFFNLDPNGTDVWEHPDVRREFSIDDAKDLWAIEGSSALLSTEPKMDRKVAITAPQRTPDGRFAGAMFCHVWVDRARTALHTNLPVDANGKVTFKTYGGVTTSLKFHTATNWETVDRHAIDANESTTKPFYAVLDRFQLLREPPPASLYTDPPFQIRRPGVSEASGFLNFVLHAPKAARVRVWGQWMGVGAAGVDLQMTKDQTFWWTRIPVAQLGGEYHGAEYAYIIDLDRHSQDPAAGWVVNSGFNANSRLVRRDKFVWTTDSWQPPTWDYYIVYQAHPKRLSDRGEAGLWPLQRVAWEIENNAGYFRELGATALLLLPINEFAGDSSWGYNPAFYYAIESSYGGPDALKQLVDTCHRNGIAVILDLVFNHSGNDNPLWELGRETFFDGDTTWGALVNFDHPQCKFFFEKCVSYLFEEFRIDGIRLDHTRTILHGDWQDGGIVTRAGSGGGWDFLQAIHWAARQQGDRCLVVGEHLPNEWNISRNGGPLDSQWNDNFHDRIEDVFRPFGDLGKLAEAYRITHTEGVEWFASTNYAESHDEVGNEDDRIARVAGYERGLRGAKVHAAAVLMSRGMPMWFMGAESAEWRQFLQRTDDVLPIADYLADVELRRVRLWWKQLCELRRDDPSLRGPAPIDVKYAQDRMLGFTRGMNGDFYVLVNFGSWAGQKSLAELNLPDGEYCELWNSTWDEFRNASENEQLRHNGGRNARLRREYTLNIPDTAAIILQRV